MEQTKEDIQYVINLTKIKSPKNITIIIAPKWKYDLYESVNKLLKKDIRNPSEIIKNLMQKEFKIYGKEIPKIVMSIIKNPELVLGKSIESKFFKENQDRFEKSFNCKISIEDADKFKNPKSNHALPGKPAILIE